MKVLLKPLYSQLNPGVGHCALGCQEVCRVSAQSSLCPPQDSTCPLSKHQAETCAIVQSGEADVIFNTAATGDGKSLAAYLPGLLDRNFRIVGLYPTIELVKDQERQIKRYYETFDLDSTERVDSLYGSELARRVEEANKAGKPGKKYDELRRSLVQKRIILTNPDIFHLITHLRYQNIATAHDQLLNDLAQIPSLYVADEFHIFGVHQESAILNSLLLLRHSRESQRPLRFLFTSATPKKEFYNQLKALHKSNFRIEQVKGEYISEDLEQAPAGYRQICQKVELKFVQLERDKNSLDWLGRHIQAIKNILQSETKRPGRGLIILNSMALVRRTVVQLKTLLEPDVIVREVSGIVDDRERSITRQELETATRPVLIVGTSAVDVGVDFDIHLLIFEASDSATFTQRLGRLGRHPGFSQYQAFALIPGWMTWIFDKLRDRLTEGQQVDRKLFREEIVEYAFDAPREFRQYRDYWGALQSQGMLISLSGANLKGEKRKYERQERRDVTRQLRDCMADDLRIVYGEKLDKKQKHWFALSNDETGQAIQEELLRFRGGSDLQSAVWDEEKSRFYTYDLLKLLPHAEVAVITKKEFWLGLEQANQKFPQSAKRSPAEFPERYIQIYLKLKYWIEDQSPFPIELECDYLTRELELCTLTLLEGIVIKSHPQQADLNRYLSTIKLLTFLVPIGKRHYQSHWGVSNDLRLSPTFGIHRISDQQKKPYACAFNQDALLLEALKWKIDRCANTEPYIY